MTRLVSKLPLATALALALTQSGTAHAETQAEMAARLNEEGKQLMYVDQPAEAAKKFQEAIAYVAEARYFVNLCTAQLGAGLLSEALTACESVDISASATPDQKAKAKKLIERINEEAAKQKLVLKPVGGGGGDQHIGQGQGGTGTPSGQGGAPADPQQPPARPPVVGRPVGGQSLVAAVPPDHRYTWSLGVDLIGGPAQIGRSDYYGNIAGGIRIKSDFLLSASHRFGLQSFLQAYSLTKGDDQMDTDAEALTVADFGLALFKHVCLGNTPRLCITPLIGAQVAVFGPESDFGSTDYSALGARGELALAYAFGSRYEHVLSVSGGANVYSSVMSGPTDEDIEFAGLDKGGFMGYLGFGYTYRFNTPLGRSPFITLE